MRDSDTDGCRNYLQGHIVDINLKGETNVPSYQYSDTEAMKGNGIPLSALKRVGDLIRRTVDGLAALNLTYKLLLSTKISSQMKSNTLRW